MRSSTVLRSYAVRALTCALLFACDNDPNGPSTTTTTGGIRVSVSMTGVDLPPSYDIVVGGRTTSADQDSATTISDLLPGLHNVRLGVTPNCQVEGTNPRQIRVAGGEITPVEFSVSCLATTGAIRVTTATTGIDVDPDGYVIRVTGFRVGGTPFQENVSVATTGTVTIPGIVGGNASVTLTGLSVNCDAASLNPRAVPVVVADTVAVAFDAVCAAATSQLAYVAAFGGGNDIYLVNGDGSGIRRLTTDPSSEEDPAWSPDGKKIAFTTTRDANLEIYVMDADGANTVRLTNEPAAEYHPAWSPDGARIAFVSERDGNAEIYLMNTDGTNVVRLTNSAARDADPAWSPDGRRIAFTSERQGMADIFVMDANGSDPVRLTTTGGRHPAWSPDGNTLAFTAPLCSWYYGCYATIYFKATAGLPVHFPLAVGERPAWSPDGRKIAYDASRCDFYYITCEPIGFQIARVDGTDIIGATSGRSPAWKP